MAAAEAFETPVKVAGSRPGPPGLGAHQGPGTFKTTQTFQITIFRKPPGRSLAKAWVSAETAASEVGTGGKRSRDTPPTPPCFRVGGPPKGSLSFFMFAESCPAGRLSNRAVVKLVAERMKVTEDLAQAGGL